MKPRTPRSPSHLAWLRTLPCAWCGRPPPSEASHHGRRGVGLKSSDLDAVPLCRRCHGHHHGPRYAGTPPLPLIERRTALAVWTWGGAEVREWAAGYAMGLRYRRAIDP